MAIHFAMNATLDFGTYQLSKLEEIQKNIIAAIERYDKQIRAELGLKIQPIFDMVQITWMTEDWQPTGDITDEYACSHQNLILYMHCTNYTVNTDKEYWKQLFSMIKDDEEDLFVVRYFATLYYNFGDGHATIYSDVDLVDNVIEALNTNSNKPSIKAGNYIHNKTGTHYDVLYTAVDKNNDTDIQVVYKDFEDNPNLYVRELKDFLSKFTLIE